MEIQSSPTDIDSSNASGSPPSRYTTLHGPLEDAQGQPVPSPVTDPGVTTNIFELLSQQPSSLVTSRWEQHMKIILIFCTRIIANNNLYACVCHGLNRILLSLGPANPSKETESGNKPRPSSKPALPTPARSAKPDGASGPCGDLRPRRLAMTPVADAVPAGRDLADDWFENGFEEDGEEEATQVDDCLGDLGDEEVDIPPTVPLITDTKARKPKAGELQLSKGAINARMRRIFTPLCNGKLKVSQQVMDDWHSGGHKSKKRKNLEQIFQLCGYDPDHWLTLSHVVCVVSFLVTVQFNTAPLPKCSSFHAQETFIEEVEVLRQELEETEVVIDGEYVSRDHMLNDWQWSEQLE